ncbi:MAG TPA: hypothetical protein VN836_10590 [Verrucomicrobiae bacterium]|nr:hypothetical protein [Verrucomicrobiae bacterium]
MGGILFITFIVVIIAITLGKPTSSMKSQIKKVFIVLVLAFQLLVVAAIFFDPLHGPFDSDYRHEERVKAYLDWKQNPSPSSKAAYEEELRLVHSHLDKRNTAIVAMLALEAIGFYYLWNRKTKAVA